MKTLAEQISERCTHFNGLMGRGMQDDSTTRCCDAGVVYLTVKSTDDSVRGFSHRYPCFREGESLPCPKRHFPTPEEVAAEVEEHDQHFKRTCLAMKAAQEDAKMKGFKKGSGGNGKVPCPVCKTGTLHYSVAGYNGHMHGRCETKECVSWMQ